MCARHLRPPIVIVMVALFFGGLMPALAGDTVEASATMEMPQTGFAFLANTPLGMLSAALDGLLTPVIKAYDADDLRRAVGQASDRHQDEVTASREPLFAGGAGGDEPAGPWP